MSLRGPQAAVPRRYAGKARTAIAACILTVLVGTMATGEAAAVESQTTCRTASVPIEVGGQYGTIAGTLCTPPDATTVQLLVPGWSYNRHYWETPPSPGASSYVQSANRAGYATFAIDRLGTGSSLRPLSLFMTFQNDVAATHAAVKALRDGALGISFDKVIGVGHSLGSLVVTNVAGRYGGLDALITTGFTHLLNYTNAAAKIIGHDYLASGDPKFASLGLDPLYVTSEPGTRHIFSYGPNTHPSVKKLDETVLKDTANLIEAATLLNYSIPNSNHNLNIPVLVVTGDHDQFFCGMQSATCTSSASLLQHEKRWYGEDATVEAYLPPHTGHAVTMERTAPESIARMLDFANRHIGNGNAVTGTMDSTMPVPTTPPHTTPDIASVLANQALLTAVKPIADAYGKATAEVPGLGNTTNPVPASAKLLAKLANLLQHLPGAAAPAEALESVQPAPQ